MPLIWVSVLCPFSMLSIGITSVPLFHMDDWFWAWVLSSVFISGYGLRSTDAWFSTSLDLGEYRDSSVHTLVSDVA